MDVPPAQSEENVLETSTVSECDFEGFPGYDTPPIMKRDYRRLCFLHGIIEQGDSVESVRHRMHTRSQGLLQDIPNIQPRTLERRCK